MRLPGVKFLTDKWVLGGLLVGAGIYWFTSKPTSINITSTLRHKGFGDDGYGTTPSELHTYFPHYDTAGQYELGGPLMRFSGQAELQRRLTIT